MVKHVILWKFKPGTEAEMRRFLDGLRGLQGQIPQIAGMEIGVNENPDNGFDAALIATFRSMEDLEIYKKDPRHIAVSALCKAIRTERAAVDYTF